MSTYSAIKGKLPYPFTKSRWYEWAYDKDNVVELRDYEIRLLDFFCDGYNQEDRDVKNVSRESFGMALWNLDRIEKKHDNFSWPEFYECLAIAISNEDIPDDSVIQYSFGVLRNKLGVTKL